MKENLTEIPENENTLNFALHLSHLSVRTMLRYRLPLPAVYAKCVFLVPFASKLKATAAARYVCVSSHNKVSVNHDQRDCNHCF